MIEITNLQLLWLTSRGGRDISDVVVHNDKPCIVMRYCREDKFVKIPSDKEITKQYYAGIRTYDNTETGVTLNLRKRPLY